MIPDGPGCLEGGCVEIGRRCHPRLRPRQMARQRRREPGGLAGRGEGARPSGRPLVLTPHSCLCDHSSPVPATTPHPCPRPLLTRARATVYRSAASARPTAAQPHWHGLPDWHPHAQPDPQPQAPNRGRALMSAGCWVSRGCVGSGVLGLAGDSAMVPPRRLVPVPIGCPIACRFSRAHQRRTEASVRQAEAPRAQPRSGPHAPPTRRVRPQEHPRAAPTKAPGAPAPATWLTHDPHAPLARTRRPTTPRLAPTRCPGPTPPPPPSPAGCRPGARPRVRRSPGTPPAWRRRPRGRRSARSSGRGG